MSIPNREPWYFKATPREMQFAVVGFAVAWTALAPFGAKPEGAAYALAYPGLVVVFLILGAARSGRL